MAKDTGTAEAKAPEVEREVDFVGAAGKPDAPEKKKDLTSEQPSFQENPANAAEEEEKAKKAKKAGEDLNIAPQQPATETSAEEKKNTGNDTAPVAQNPDIPAVSRKNMEILNDAWGIASITKALQEALENSKISRDERSGKVRFNLANNHQIEWIPNHNGIEGFVGIPKKSKIDDLDAKMIIATLATQGHKQVNVFGDRESKEKMWLEAMRQGLGVANFQPLPSDDPNSVYQTWLREAQDLQTGAAADPNAITPETPADKPAEETAEAETPAETTAETAEAEAPAETAAETAEAEAPTETAAETAEAEAPTETAAETAEAEAPAETAAETAEAETPAETAAETAEAEAPAETAAETAEAETPAVPEDKGGLKSSFLTDKPAAEEVKAEAQAKDAPVAEETAPEKPATKSAFIGDAADKKDAPAPKAPEVPTNESFEETLARRIEQAKNPKVEAALRTLKAELDSGNLKLDGIDREFVHAKLSGSKPLSVKNVNAAIGYAAGKPENKGIVLPTVDDDKPSAPQHKRKNPGLG